MKKLANFKIVFLMITFSFAIFSGIKGYRYVTNLTNLPAFLLENAEALAEGETGISLRLECITNNLENSICRYRCSSCSRLYEAVGDGKELVKATGRCICGAMAN